jgi:dipeptidyl aminopeptidase/acylaminoacyl peptidase
MDIVTRGRRSPLAAAAALSLVAGLGGCDDGPIGPSPETTRIAQVEQVGARPALYIMREDGTGRAQVHFDGAADDISGNMGDDILPVRDDRILAMGPVKWSPDGERLAIVVTLAFDQSQIVIVDRDGGNARTASVNSQIIMSDIAWSPDGKHIAYLMSTLPRALGRDLFVTDLEENRVRRITNGANYGIVALAWNGSDILLAESTGEQGGEVSNTVSRILRIDAATGATTVLASDIVGTVRGVAPGGGWFIVLRNRERAGSDYLRDVVRVTLPGRAEKTLLASQRTIGAEITGDSRRVLLIVNGGTGGDVSPLYRIVASGGGNVRDLRILDTTTIAADVHE